MATDEKKVPAPDPVAELPQYDAMSAAFDEIIKPESTTSADDPPEKKETPPAAKKEGAEGEPAEKKETPAAKTEGEETPPEKKEPPAEGEETPPGDTTEGEEKKDWKTEYDTLVAANKKRDETAAAKVENEEEPAPKPAARKETPPPEIYSSEEKTFLDGYEKEWPDIVKGEALRRRAEYGAIVRHVFNEIHNAYGPLIERGVIAADNVAENTTLQFIRQAHSDYDDSMYDAIVEWADGLTGYRQKLAKEIIENGEPQDMVDFITEFKTVTGRNKPKAVAGDEKATTVTELSPQAKKAAKAIGVVETKRTAAAPNAADANDFDGAWAEAVGSPTK